MIVAVIGKKGGCGKSTIAVHLAGWRRAAGKDIMLVDADRQATSTMWAETRADKGMETPDTVQQFDNSVGRAVRSLARHYEDIVVDVGGGEEAATASVLRVADIAIVPFQPNELDVWTVGALEDLLEAAKALNTELRVNSVLNRASTHHRVADTSRTLEALENCNEIVASNVVVRERSAIRRCVPAGQLIDEWKPRDQKARDELTGVYELAFGAVKEPVLA